MAAFYTNENFPLKVVLALREQAELIDEALRENGDLTGKLVRINRKQK